MKEIFNPQWIGTKLILKYADQYCPSCYNMTEFNFETFRPKCECGWRGIDEETLSKRQIRKEKLEKINVKNN